MSLATLARYSTGAMAQLLHHDPTGHTPELPIAGSGKKKTGNAPSGLERSNAFSLSH